MAYLENWKEGGFEAMVGDFSLNEATAKEVALGFEVMHAYYSDEDYSGSAFVILRSRADGGLWEVHGSHCSCHGLEDQWDPEPTELKALLSRHEAQPLPGMDEDSGGSWLRSLVEERDLTEMVPDPARQTRRKVSL